VNPLAIKAVSAWEVLDSRGRPTVACEVRLACNARGQASVPSGASKGRYEAVELRDGGMRYGGLGARSAVASIRSELASAVQGLNAADQIALDDALVEADATPRLERLGANAVLAVSIASAVAAASGLDCELYEMFLEPGEGPLLPLPMINIISGGAHAGSMIDLQDLLVIPVGAKSFTEGLEWAARVRAETAALLSERGISTALVADEGGLGAQLHSNQAAIEILTSGIERCGFALGTDVGIALDVAASQLWSEGNTYNLATDCVSLGSGEFIDKLHDWCRTFPILSIEDPLGEDDWEGWAYASEVLRGVQLVGDDLFATDVNRVRRAVEGHIGSGVLVKPNQCGTLTRARAAANEANRAGYAPIISARSGDTEDTWLVDLAVGWRSGQIKVGSTARSERTAKWNRLAKIEALSQHGVEYAGSSALRRL
jgi:enolase